MPNVEEIKSIVKLIEAEPGTWNQESWVEGSQTVRVKLASPLKTWRFGNGEYVTEVYGIDGNCYTACCVAGHAIMRAGLVYAHGAVYDPETGEALGGVDSVAQNLLGLDYAQANVIFSSEADGHLKTTKGRVNRLKANITKATGITFD